MTINELIQSLQEIRDEEGNVDIVQYRRDSGEEWISYQFPFPVVIPVTEEESYGVTIVSDMTGREEFAKKRVVQIG